MPGSGNGAQSLGQELAHSGAFLECQAEKVFKALCFKEPSNASDHALIDTMVNNFSQASYAAKSLFADAAVYCMGE